MENPIAAVRAFARKREIVAFAIELRAPFDQILNGRGALFLKPATPAPTTRKSQYIGNAILTIVVT
jgi:hypothetical protein